MISLEQPSGKAARRTRSRTSLKVPKGTRMRFEFRYDNSVNNKYNPDPNRWVYQGFQSWEEMMAPNLGFLVDRDADVGGLMSVSN